MGRRLGTCGAIAFSAALLGCTPKPSAELTPVATPVEVGVEPVARRDKPAPACSARTPRSALALIPDTSNWIIHLSPREVLGSAIAPLLTSTLAENHEWGQVQEVLAGCGYALADLDHLLIGLDAKAEQFAIVVAAPDIGRPESARCLVGEIQRVTNTEQPTLVGPVAHDPNDPSVSVIELDAGRVYLFADDLLALTSTAWQDELGRLGRCEGVAAIVGSNRELLDRVDINAPIWVTGRLAPEVSAELETALGLSSGGIRDLALSLRVDDGALLALEVRLRDAQTAAQLGSLLQTGKAALAGLVDQVGAKILARAIIDVVGLAVLVRVSASAEDLRQLPATP